jgi:hypothetical protein
MGGFSGESLMPLGGAPKHGGSVILALESGKMPLLRYF